MDDMNEDQLMTYGSYLDSICADPYEDEYDKSVCTDELIIVDNSNPYIYIYLKTTCVYNDRF